MKLLRKTAVFLTVFAVFSLFFSGCGKQTDRGPNPKSDTLVVGTLNFDGKFSPFFYTNSYENDILRLVHLYLLDTDREGSVVLQGIEGETRPYNGTDYTYRGIANCTVTENPNGTVFYDITLREGVQFSDGTTLDIDDVIFSLYVPLDPSYDGTMTLYSLPIEGLQEYREGDARSISGIQRTGDRSLRIVLTELSATAIYDLATAVVPMHYYGNEALYNYENQMFGFTKGDLSTVRSVTTAPQGGGPYKFVSYTGGTVTLEANPLYWKGEPKIRYIQFREGQEADKVTGMVAGTIDITDPSYSTQTAKSIMQANGGELSGSVMQTVLTPNPGYGYVGINAKNVCVGGNPGSEESRALRKALATVIAVYRDVAVDSYYGAFANVIHYPISDTSWAAPRVTDEGYRTAFSVDPEGNSIYAEGMTDQERYDAALETARDYFALAGYTLKDGRLTKAPKGASMGYEVLIGAGGTGDHPTFMALSLAAESLKKIGFTLTVTDLSNFSELTNAVNAGTAELFSMAWSATPDPDLYQVYHSQGGSNETSYFIKDDTLDELIILARQSSDQGYRKALYRECLDIIADWAVEIPMYQRQNATVFSPARIDLSSLTPDMTTFWNWENDIQNLRLK